MQKHLYLTNFFDVNPGGNSFAKYVAGQSYEITEETTRHVVQGFAQEVDVQPVVVDEPADSVADEAPAATTEAEQPAA